MKFFRKAISVLLATAVAVTINVTSFAATITIPDNEATKVVSALGTGWNLGNAFDSSDCTWLSNELDYESGWCGAKTTKALIEKIADIGFQTIRIPVSWHNHVDSNYTVSTAWMNRVQEVVDWCIEEDLFVILNVHHDISTSYYYPSSTYYSNSEKYLTTVWQQIADKFKNYDHHLIFETINEPRLVNHNNEWWFDMNNVPPDITDSVDCINRLNQAALDTIRKSGGKNSDRFILVPGYDTSIDGITISGFKMPTDTVANRLIANFHLYTYDESTYKSVVDRVYNAYTSKGIPAILSEYNMDSSNSNTYTDSSASFLSSLVGYSSERGICSIIWDNNATEYKLIDRATATWVHEDIAKAIVNAGKSDISLKLNSPVITHESFTENSATISWEAVSGAESYVVYRAASLNGAKTKLASGITSLSYTDKTVSSGNTYYYFVTSYDEGFSTESDCSAPSIVTINCAITSPTNVKAVSGGGNVTITWDAVENATSYRVFRSDSLTGARTLLKVRTSLYYIDTEVDTGKTYYYWLMAYNANKDVKSSYSSSSKVTVTDDFAKDISIKSVSVLSTSVTLKWDIIPGATSYRIYRRDDSGSRVLLAAQSMTEFKDTGLTKGKVYKYEIRAYSKTTGKLSAYSPIKQVRPIAAPAILSGNVKGKITWEKNAVATSYRVYRADSLTGAKKLLAPTTLLTYTDKTAEIGKTYYYFVAAYDNSTGTLSAYSQPKIIKIA